MIKLHRTMSFYEWWELFGDLDPHYKMLREFEAMEAVEKALWDLLNEGPER